MRRAVMIRVTHHDNPLGAAIRTGEQACLSSQSKTAQYSLCCIVRHADPFVVDKADKAIPSVGGPASDLAAYESSSLGSLPASRSALLTAGVNPQNSFCEYGPLTDLGGKRYPRKSNVTVSLLLASIVLAVDNPRLRRMRFQTTLGQSNFQRFANALRLHLTLAVCRSACNIGSDAILVPSRSRRADETCLKQVQLGTSVHLTLNELELGDLALGLSVGP